MSWFDKVIIKGITYLAHDNEIQELKTSANAGKALVIKSTGDAVETQSIAIASAYATDNSFNAKEKVGVATSGTINLANGSIQSCSATSITLPTVVSGFTLTLLCTAVVTTWSGQIKWQGVALPSMESGDNIVTFVGIGNYWYGCYSGVFGNV